MNNRDWRVIFALLIVFTNSAFPLVTSSPADPNIQEIRQLILNIQQQNKTVFHPNDVEDIKLNDWSISRFLQDTGNNVDKAVSRLVSAMAFKQKIGSHRPVDHYPAEFFSAHVFSPCGKSRAGNFLFPFVGIKLLLTKHLQHLLTGFFYHLYDRLDRQAVQNQDQTRGIDMVADLNGFGMSNAGLYRWVQIFNEAREHFPGTLKTVYVYRFPWVYKVVWGFFKLFMSTIIMDKLVYINSMDEMEKYVDFNQLSEDIFPGTNDKCRMVAPIGVESGVCLDRFSYIPDGEWVNLYNTWKDEFIDEIKFNNLNSVLDLFPCRNATAKERLKRIVEQTVGLPTEANGESGAL